MCGDFCRLSLRGCYVRAITDINAEKLWASKIRPAHNLPSSQLKASLQANRNRIAFLCIICLHLLWKLLKSAEEVTLTVATTSQLPSSVVVAQTYSWVTPDGRPTSPPPEYNPRLHHHQVSRVSARVRVWRCDGRGIYRNVCV
ncbi:uncharacterized protein [Penaeus vannamei]|uniref:uncharacterized protein n=1 Tax=Penaeus vannamei TaxID=6689 RepID=UPI00387F4109